MTQHINTAADISPQAIELFKQLCEVAELVHHTDYPRATLIEKIQALDRGLANQCYEDLTRISKPNKPYEPNNTNRKCQD